MQSMTLPQSPEPIDATLLPTLFDLYLQERVDKHGVLSRSIAGYRERVAPFFLWLDQQPTKMLDTAAFARYHHWLIHEYRTMWGKPVMLTTVIDRHGMLRIFLGWCFRNGCTGAVNLAELIPPAPDAKPEVHFPTLDELCQLFAGIAGRARLRNLAMIATLLATAARRSEIAAVTVRDVYFDADHTGYIHLRHTKGDMDGLGYGRPVAFDATTGRLLRIWLGISGQAGDARLFALTSGNSVTVAVGGQAERAGVPQITPHGLRRAFSEYWSEHLGAEHYVALKLQMGHSMARDMTQSHYLDKRNIRRIAATIRRSYVSPMREIAVDWDSLP